MKKCEHCNGTGEVETDEPVKLCEDCGEEAKVLFTHFGTQYECEKCGWFGLESLDGDLGNSSDE